jgi:hypothetical protein
MPITEESVRNVLLHMDTEKKKEFLEAVMAVAREEYEADRDAYEAMRDANEADEHHEQY